jgi:hypothetical protein
MLKDLSGLIGKNSPFQCYPIDKHGTHVIKGKKKCSKSTKKQKNARQSATL